MMIAREIYERIQRNSAMRDLEHQKRIDLTVDEILEELRTYSGEGPHTFYRKDFCDYRAGIASVEDVAEKLRQLGLIAVAEANQWQSWVDVTVPVPSDEEEKQ